MEKLIITAAITGSRITRQQSPFIPITPEEIVQSAIESWRAGASIVHIHVRDPETGLGCQELSLFERVVTPLREKTDLILCLTTSGIPGKNLPTKQRLTPLRLKPELASLDTGSINLGNALFANPPEFLDEAARRMREAGVKPELEVFDLGMIMTCLKMLKEGKLDPPLHFQFVMGTPYGAPATPKALLHLQEHLPSDATWSVLGAGRGSLPMAMMALIMGGHVRVGMEDTIYFSKDVLAKSNAQFVERIVRLAKDYGREVATPAEARKILGLKSKTP
jgi:3-keto-5-aminohexanoate cleavage enzyme